MVKHPHVRTQTYVQKGIRLTKHAGQTSFQYKKTQQRRRTKRIFAAVKNEQQ
jgi:hypothetical protein